MAYRVIIVSNRREPREISENFDTVELARKRIEKDIKAGFSEVEPVLDVPAELTKEKKVAAFIPVSAIAQLYIIEKD